jgi:uncharacterized protein
MIRHLTPAEYTAMPWANGRGTTVEMLRETGPDGGLLLRLSMASVVENGPFSIFPGIERNLTVISGPGFDLVGETRITAAPFMPVAFPGDVPIAATAVITACEDFNVMTARAQPLPEVRVQTDSDVVPPRAGRLAVFALNEGSVSGRAAGKHDLIITDEKARLEGGPFIVVGFVTD